MGILYTVLFFGGTVLVWAVISRRRQYRYPLRKDYSQALGEGTTIQLEGATCTIAFGERQTCIVQCRVESRWYGLLLQPYIETVNESGSRRHYLEHGAKGVRYLDLSDAGEGERTVRFKAHRCRIDTSVTLYRFDNPLGDRSKVLILSPHADDAEIAAFGLYSSHDSYVVTVTAGEEGKCDYCDLFASEQEGRKEKGLLRLHDALHIPDMGGVGVEKCAVLGYFGMTLKRMYDERAQPVRSNATGIESIGVFRRTSHVSFIENANPAATWDSLVRDLQSALEKLQPDIVVTPHPKIDSNSDHRYTTVALAEAVRRCGYEGKMLTYTNHFTVSEMYPQGAMFSAVMLPPWFETPFPFDTIYTHPVKREAQVRKFFALEAMHDLRDATLPLSLTKAWKLLKRMLKRDIGGRDKSYFRRAVRSNELFYVFDASSLESAI